MNESPILYLSDMVSCALCESVMRERETHGTSSSSSASSNSVETSSRSSLSFYVTHQHKTVIHSVSMLRKRDEPA